MKEIQSPSPIDMTIALTVFLGGSIEMGTASDWQTELIASLADQEVVLLNPRRSDWDSTWIQEASNPQFRQQVEWELNALSVADLIVFYFDPATRSPITLLELGLYAASGKVVVCSPPGYWRRGNIELVCERCKVPIYATMPELIKHVKERIKPGPARFIDCTVTL